MFLKQKNIPWLGAIVESLFTSLPVLSIINFLAVITVLYATVREYLLVWIPWMTIWIFVGAMFILVMFLMMCIYKFVLPSLWTFRGKQLYGFESELFNEVKSLREQMLSIEEMHRRE